MKNIQPSKGFKVESFYSVAIDMSDMWCEYACGLHRQYYRIDHQHQQQHLALSLSLFAEEHKQIFSQQNEMQKEKAHQVWACFFGLSMVWLGSSGCSTCQRHAFISESHAGSLSLRILFWLFLIVCIVREWRHAQSMFVYDTILQLGLSISVLCSWHMSFVSIN